MKLFGQKIDSHSLYYLTADYFDFVRHHSWRQNLNLLRFLLGHKRKPIHVPWNPVRITIGIEYRCNLQCVFCPWHSRDRRKSIIPFRCGLPEVQNILEPFIEHDLAHVHFCATGETTLNKDLPDMVRYANSRGLTSSFMSNFSRVVTPKLDEIAELPLLKVYGNLDTGDPLQFDAMRKGHSWKVLCDNISALAEKRDQAENRFEIGLYALMMKSNAHTFMDIMRTAANIGVDTLQMVYLAPTGINDDTSVDNAVYLEDAEIVAQLKAARDYGRKLGLRVYMTPFASRQFCGDGVKCDNLWWKLFINMDDERGNPEDRLGNVSSQCEVSFDRVGYSFGNILRDGFDACWNGQRIKELRRRLSKDPPDVCRRCPGR